MLDEPRVTALRERLGAQEGPVASLYLDVDPTLPENQRGAPYVRAEQALLGREMPKAAARAFVDRLRAEAPSLRGRTLVAFSGANGAASFEHLTLQQAVPGVREPGVLARWGPPFLAPLVHLLHGSPRTGVVLLDTARFRYFEIRLSDIEEVHDAFRPLDPSTWRSLSEDATGTPGVPARGGSGHDQFERRKEAWSERFQRNAIGWLATRLRKWPIEHLILVGPEAILAGFREGLPPSLRERVRDARPPLPDLDASGEAVLASVAPLVERAEDERADALVEVLAASPVRGVEATLEALQEGRLRMVVTRWSAERTVYRSAEPAYVAGSLSSAQRHAPGVDYELISLEEVLPELAERHGAELTYLERRHATRLEDCCGGMAGLPRW